MSNLFKVSVVVTHLPLCCTAAACPHTHSPSAVFFWRQTQKQRHFRERDKRMQKLQKLEMLIGWLLLSWVKINNHTECKKKRSIAWEKEKSFRESLESDDTCYCVVLPACLSWFLGWSRRNVILNCLILIPYPVYEGESSLLFQGDNGGHRNF